MITNLLFVIPLLWREAARCDAVAPGRGSHARISEIGDRASAARQAHPLQGSVGAINNEASIVEVGGGDDANWRSAMAQLCCDGTASPANLSPTHSRQPTSRLPKSAPCVETLLTTSPVPMRSGVALV